MRERDRGGWKRGKKEEQMLNKTHICRRQVRTLPLPHDAFS